MSWLYSIIFASLLISSGGNLPEINNYNYSNFSSKNVFKLTRPKDSSNPIRSTLTAQSAFQMLTAQ